MNPIPHNFYYDPIRQGVGRGVWNWYVGSPFQQGGYLALLNTRGVMYYDVGKGCISFTIKVPSAPTDGANRQWGVKAGDDYVLFDISADTFQAKTSSTRSTQQSSSSIPWDSLWTSTDTTFMVRWEAGICSFYVNNILRTQISDASIPNGPMSPYVSSDALDLFLLKSVVGQGLQTLVLNPFETTTDGGEAMAQVIDSVALTESYTVKADPAPSVSSSIAIAESTTITNTNLPRSLNDTVTSAESVTVTRI